MSEAKRENGKFLKGQSGNPKGKVKGVQNLPVSDVRQALKDVLIGGVEKFKTELDKLDGRDYVNAYLAAGKFVLPPLAPESPIIIDVAESLPRILISPPDDAEAE